LPRAAPTVTYAPRSLEAVVPVAADLAIVAVKAYDTDGRDRDVARALAEVRRKPRSSDPQNGVGNEEKLAAAFGADAIVSAALTVPVEKSRDGKPSSPRTAAASRSRRSARQAHNWLVAAFESAAHSGARSPRTTAR
jgi:ketopantoate reductase